MWSMKASETSIARFHYLFLLAGPCVNSTSPTSVGPDKSGANERCTYELGIDPATCPFFSSAEGSPRVEEKP
ncbi:hypothetical protein ARMGADRAFT_80847 [Armillaria gallica]|uniref:Secreted protein n=1 Tax=Armillaria gallica TaxID=47427 RepID=A0A2H3CB29_ARMGA|nr:hypothetical protein ARMGADRAFT_80847 [Armillaria gallica]